MRKEPEWFLPHTLLGESHANYPSANLFTPEKKRSYEYTGVQPVFTQSDFIFGVGDLSLVMGDPVYFLPVRGEAL
jgi:hypothetical protein